MSNADHSGICKFESKVSGYMLVLDRLTRIREALIDRDVNETGPTQNVPTLH